MIRDRLFSLSIRDHLFLLGQRFGFNITRNHYYSPIADLRELPDDFWSKRSELVGIHINEKKQIELLACFESKFKGEYDAFPTNATLVPYEYHINNGLFGSVDGEILYCFIRHFKPDIIVEVGSGFSTYLTAQAILKNEEDDDDYNCDLIAIEPYPNSTLQNGFPGLSKLIQKKVQDVPLSEFDKLSKGDVLFIDSTHVLKTGGDVQHDYLEILPKLAKGVIIHVHDIFLPAEYPKASLLGPPHAFWNEQYLLQAFLSFNDSFDVLWAGSFMHLNHPDILESAFSSYLRDGPWPGSFWIRKVR